MRILDSQDVRELVSMDDVIDAVARAYRQLGEGSAIDIPRENIRLAGLDGSFKALSAMSETAGTGGFFYTGGFPGDAPTMATLVYSESDGGLQTVVESDRLSWIRTGATSAVATDHCARSDASTLGLIGSGTYAESQLLGVEAVRDLDRVRVFSPTKNNRDAFADCLSPHIEATIEPVDTAESAVTNAGIICTATTANDPVFDGEDLDPGTHVNAIGSHYPEQREVDSRTVERSRVIADTRARARKEEGELLLPIEAGRLSWDDILELGSIVAGDIAGRIDDREVTLFTSGGLGIEYLVVAREVYDRALEAEMGTEVTMTPEVDHL